MHKSVAVALVFVVSACARSSPSAPAVTATLQGRAYQLFSVAYAQPNAPENSLPTSLCVPGYDSASVTAGSLLFAADTAVEVLSIDQWKAGVKSTVQSQYLHPYSLVPVEGGFSFTYYLIGQANQEVLDTASTVLPIEHDHGSFVGCGANQDFVYHRTH